MTSHRASVLVAAGLLAFGATGVFTATTSTASTPSSTGCPSGFEILSLAFLASQGGYQQPFSLDAAGNNDGFVCGKSLPIVACGAACPVPVLYTFIENDLTPAH